jgi:hypothetical protein
VATATDAWRHAFARSDDERSFEAAALPALAVAVIVAFVLGFLVERTGTMIVDVLSDDVAWVTLGAIQGAARAIAAPFALSALVSGRIAKEAPLVTPKLY